MSYFFLTGVEISIRLNLIINPDGLAKSSKRRLHSTETQRVITFSPLVARLFATPTTPLSRRMPDYHEHIASFEETCKAHGLKITHQRLEIYRALLKSTEHPSSEALYKELVKRIPSLSLDTVYRTLATFEELGLANRVQTVQSQTRYEAKVRDHHHLICDKCKKIIDFQWQGFDDINIPEEVSRLGTISSRNVTLKGICAECLVKEETRER